MPESNTRQSRRPWLLTVILLLIVALSTTQILDDRSADFVDAALKRALVTFGIARTLNGVISVAQGTEVALEPAGVGVIVAAGELLDPVNDLVERFSWVMLMASTSLGVQKVLLTISAWWAVTLALALAAALHLYVTWRGTDRAARLAGPARRLLVIALFARFALPFLVVLNQYAADQFLAEKQQAAAAALEQSSEEIRQLEAMPEPAPGDGSLSQRISAMIDAGMEMLDIEARVDKLRSTLTGATERIIELIVLFMLETVLFPLFFLWLFLRALKMATRE